jgi:hypothetical protein
MIKDTAFNILLSYVFPYSVGSLSPQQGASSGCRWMNGLWLWRLAANILNKQPRTNDKGLGVGLQPFTIKN